MQSSSVSSRHRQREAPWLAARAGRDAEMSDKDGWGPNRVLM